MARDSWEAFLKHLLSLCRMGRVEIYKSTRASFGGIVSCLGGCRAFLMECDNAAIVKRCKDDNRDFSPVGIILDEFKMKIEPIEFNGVHKISRNQNVLAKHAISLDHLSF